MTLAICLRPELMAVDICAATRKRALEMVSTRLADALEGGVSADAIFDGLLARERLGSTGLGQGLAFPHCRLAALSHPAVGFFRLQAPVDFESMDGAPVDLLAVLLVPESATDAHLKLLGALAQLLEPEANRAALRRASSAAALAEVLTGLCAG
ncbi:MAG: PTS sugar transporter subunit IIA [Pseudomonadota bacterium]|nr:PTS sugar transporter subunit IIA [Pseudomonadota bacterium]MED5443328.1 PTS sugar transporter subunit IIA [Pseudomonadota bacterium]